MSSTDVTFAPGRRDRRAGHEQPTDDHSAGGAIPRTVVVLGLLVGAAAVFSYLATYAVTDALRDAEFLPPLPAGGADPRPRWLLAWFASLLAAFVGVGGLFRWLSRRQLRSIDAAAESDEEFRITG